jgi:hypothetical protein
LLVGYAGYASLIDCFDASTSLALPGLCNLGTVRRLVKLEQQTNESAAFLLRQFGSFSAPIVHKISLSKALGYALRDLAVAEIAHAEPVSTRKGLDGDSFYFSANGQCAFTLPLERGSRLRAFRGSIQAHGIVGRWGSRNCTLPHSGTTRP